MRLMEQWLRGLVYVARLIAGVPFYLVTRKTPISAHHGMVGLFCLTGGRSNDALSRLIGLFKRRYHFAPALGMLGDMTTEQIREPALGELRSRGFHVFERRLPVEYCDRLLQFALSQPCKTRIMDGGRIPRDVEVIYPRGAPEAVRYDFDTQRLLDNEDVQRLLADLSLAALAQEYLGARPVVDVLSMWWHTAYSNVPDSEAAQYFHFDMDRPKWVKFFIYLTDVTPQNGPHLFVAGSQRTGGIPPHLLRKGYTRLLDNEVAEVFSGKDIIEFSAPRGTILAEDTRGLHKGKHVEFADRLMLQIQYSNSLFGGVYPHARLSGHITTELRDRLARFPALYSAYLS